jgi:hypothetical protein
MPLISNDECAVPGAFEAVCARAAADGYFALDLSVLHILLVGKERCAAALADTGHGSNAMVVARNAWVEAITEPAQVAQFLRRWPNLSSADDEWQRFQRLAWRDMRALKAALDKAP